MFEAVKQIFAPSSNLSDKADKTKANYSLEAVDDSRSKSHEPNEIFNFARDLSSQIYKKAVRSGEDAVAFLSDKVKLGDIGTSLRTAVNKVPVLKDFQHMQENFAVEQPTIDSSMAIESNASLLPWHPDVSGLTDESMRSKLQSRILALSQHTNTFLVPPPAEANVNEKAIDTLDGISLARALLNEDPNLAKMRYQLVPSRISEDVFWRNYFYRVSMVRQSFQLSAMTDSGDDDYVCVDEDATWTVSADQIKDLQSPSSKKSSNVTNSTPSHQFCHKTRSDIFEAQKDNVVVCADVLVNENDLDAELAREVNEMVLVTSADTHTDDLDRELERELMAELDQS